MALPTPDHHYSNFFDISITFTFNTPILQAQSLTDWDQNAPECHAASHKTNETHSGSCKANEEPSSSHKTNEMHVGSHNHIKSPPHYNIQSQRWIPKEISQTNLPYLTLLTTLLQFQGMRVCVNLSVS